MRWYTGGIAEAVATSKATNAIFVVYIEGKDSNSGKLTSIINDPEVSTKLETDSFVALKLEANTLPHHQFAEIYSNVTVPSLYFIGKVGQPLDIVRDVEHVHELSERINKVINAHEASLSNPRISAGGQAAQLIQNERASNSSQQAVDDPCPIAEPPQTQTEESTNDQFMMNSSYTVSLNSSKVASPVENQSKAEVNVEPVKDDVSEISPKENKIESDSLTSELSKEEKIERAKELVEKKREDKAREEEEAERQKEIERRKVGQDVQKLKRWQEDQELKEILEQRKKEIVADKEARERVLAQIAQDKAERASRYRTHPSTPVSTSNVQLRQTPSLPPNSTRIQFRLPDGTSHTNVFDNCTTVFELRTYIQENIALPFRNYTLATTFPRREFTSDFNGTALAELDLGPTAVILILPISGTIDISQHHSVIARLIYTLFSPIISIYGYIMGYFRPVRGNEQTTSTERNKRSSSDSNKKQNLKRRNTDTNVQRQGNIHRFTSHNDSDDENNTWNGNSTQQM